MFCGSSSGTREVYQQAARTVGRLLCRRGIELVYGGGHVGLMGIVADACLSEGGHVIGVIPQALADREVAHTGLTELRIVGGSRCMSARRSWRICPMPSCLCPVDMGRGRNASRC